jgi:magnesium transporter
MFAQLLGPEIENLIKERDFAALKECFKEWPPADVAELISDLRPEEKVIVFRLLPQDLANRTFEYLSHHDQRQLIHAMGREDIVRVLNEMSPDDRTRLLEELPGTAVTEILKLLTPEELKVAQTLLNYPEHSVGRLMTPDFIAAKDEWTAQDVLAYIRQHGKKQETVNVIYVVDDQGRLIDDIRIAEVLLRPLETKVKDIRDNRYIALKVTDLEHEAIGLFKKYDRTALPVVDSDNRLVGIVTIDDVLDVAERETTEQIQKLGGSEALDEPYATIPFWRMVRKRATWLVMLFLGEMLTATAMGYFEEEIERAVVLALFLPLIISSGGNSGSQASTLIIRAMALGEFQLKDWWRVMGKEVRAGLALGSILGVIGFLRIGIWSMLSDVYGPYWLLVAITVGVSLVGVVLWGTLSGSMLPFLLRKCGFDPATSSAPFVATLVDVTGLVIYFTFAMLVLKGTLLSPPDGDRLKLGQEKADKAFNHLLHLGDQWETREAELRPREQKLIITLRETDELVKTYHCSRCGGHVKVTGHSLAQRWPYSKVFNWDSEIVSELPVFKCTQCGLTVEPLPSILQKQWLLLSVHFTRQKPRTKVG